MTDESWNYRRALPRQKVIQIQELGKTTKSDTEIAKEVGCSRWTVEHYLGRANSHPWGRPYGSTHPRPPPLPKIRRCMTCNLILDDGMVFLTVRRGDILGGHFVRFCSWDHLIKYAKQRTKLDDRAKRRPAKQGTA